MKSKILLLTFILTVGMLSGCQKAEETKPAERIPQETDGEQQEAAGQEEAAKQEEGAQDEVVREQEGADLEGFSFADVADREFYFSSGVGGWYTVLYIHEDGTFDGHYQDSDMGDADPVSYPNGTVYYCDFSGSFTEPEKIDDTTYAFQIESIEYPYGLGEEMKDGYHYYYSPAYGLDGAEDLYMYLPGRKVADLPDAYRSWVGYYDLESISETELPFYGLYNVKEENGFSSYVMVDAADRAEEKAAVQEAGAE